MNRLRVGTRGSKLALTQTRWVVEQIESFFPKLDVVIEVIRTSGDRFQKASLATLAGDLKGLFVKEIEEALLAGSIDCAVHSLKDLPTALPEGLTLGVIPPREDPRDALVSDFPVQHLTDLPAGGKVATSSLRRRAQLSLLRPDLEIVDIRGNIDTRIRKMRENDLAGVILALAGLNRMGLADRAAYLFEPREMVPAVGQGALAIEIRHDDLQTLHFLEQLEDKQTRECATAERRFLEAMGGGCQIPLGAHARFEGKDQASFSAFLATPSGEQVIRHSISGPASSLTKLAEQTTQHFKSHGAETIMHQAGE